MPNFLWPNKKRADSFLVRLGRVLHWMVSTVSITGMIGSLVSIVWGVVLMSNSEVEKGYGSYTYVETEGTTAFWIGLVFLVTSGLVYMLGRTLRYLFSGE